MKLPRSLAIVVLTCTVVASAPLLTVARNDPAARLHQEPADAQPVALPAASEAENLFWQSIMNSTNPAEFEAYLRRFPTGMFSDLAKIRLEALRTIPVAGAHAVADTATAATLLSIDFGDDTSGWAQDGECDDPRFDGEGMAAAAVSVDRARDATDCRRLYNDGSIRLFGIDLDSGAIDFGDDTSSTADDGDCDDPRFEGEGMDSFQLAFALGHDAADCRRLYDEGRIRLFGVHPANRR